MRLERHILKELFLNFVFTTIVLHFVATVGVVIQLFTTQRVPIQVSLLLAPIALLARSDLLIPLCFLVAVLFTYGRISAENEYVATQACGVHPARTLGPMILIGLLISLAQAWVLSFALPNLWLQRNRILDKAALEMIANIEPSQNEFEAKQVGFRMTWKRHDGFYFEDVFLDIQGAPGDRESGGAANAPGKSAESRPESSVASAPAKDEDRDEPKPLLKGAAKSVEVFYEQESIRFRIRGFRTAMRNSTYELGSFDFILNNSTLSDGGTFRARPEFLTSDVLVELALRADRRVAAAPAAAQGTTERRLIEFDKNSSRRYWYEMMKRSAWSFAALLFGFLGAPLAIWLRRGTRLAAVAVALGILFLLYFPLSKVGDALIAKPNVPVWICAFMATLVASVISGAFYYKLVRR